MISFINICIKAGIADRFLAKLDPGVKLKFLYFDPSLKWIIDKLITMDTCCCIFYKKNYYKLRFLFE